MLCESSAGKCRPGFQPRKMPSGSFCVPCAKGMFAARGGVCTACAAGSYSLEGFTKCIACPKGRFGKGASTASSCSGACSKGRWGGHGSTTRLCKGPCAPGRFGSIAGMTDHCSGWCPAGKFSLSGSTSCKVCPAGQRPAAAYGASSCVSAPTTYLPTDTAGAVVCAAGRSALAGEKMCSRCPPGRFSLGGRGGSHGATCLACPRGRFARLGAPTSLCDGPCAPGRFGRGASTQLSCDGPCSRGRYGINGESRSKCHGICSAGRWGFVGSSDKGCGGACPKGRWGVAGKPGCLQQHGHNMLTLGTGFAKPALPSPVLPSPVPNPHETKVGKTGKKRFVKSTKIGSGWTIVGASTKILRNAPSVAHVLGPNSRKRTVLSLGPGFVTKHTHSCNAGLFFDGNGCRVCLPGRYREISDSVSSCRVCPKGRYGTGGSTTRRCSGRCAAGRWGADGSIQPSCTAACPLGRWGSEGMYTSSCGGRCPAGRYGDGAASTPACTGLCRAGRFGRGGSRTARCDGACHPGRWGNAGASSPACTAACPAGRFGLGGSAGRECDGLCPAGRWGRSGSTTQACNGICAAGRYGTAGSTSPACSNACPAGRWTAPGSQNILQCHKGGSVDTSASQEGAPRKGSFALTNKYPVSSVPPPMVRMAVALVLANEHISAFKKEQSAAVAVALEATLRATVMLAATATSTFSDNLAKGINVSFVNAEGTSVSDLARSSSVTVRLIATLKMEAVHLLLQGGELAKQRQGRVTANGRLHLSAGLLSRFWQALDSSLLRVKKLQLSGTAMLPRGEIPSAWIAHAKTYTRVSSAARPVGFLGTPSRAVPTQLGTPPDLQATWALSAANLAPIDDDTMDPFPASARVSNAGENEERGANTQRSWVKPFPSTGSDTGTTGNWVFIVVVGLTVRTGFAPLEAAHPMSTYTLPFAFFDRSL